MAGTEDQQPRPTLGLLSVITILLGAIAYTAVMYRFQTYQQRNNMPPATFETFAGVMFLPGFGVGLSSAQSQLRLATLLIAGVFAAHCCVVGLDWQQDPTNHNLLPFEFIYLGALGSPAYLGVLLSRNVRRRRNSST
jgi:hypothetical protein